MKKNWAALASETIPIATSRVALSNSHPVRNLPTMTKMPRVARIQPATTSGDSIAFSIGSRTEIMPLTETPLKIRAAPSSQIALNSECRAMQGATCRQRA